jgi:hypothetical protein
MLRFILIIILFVGCHSNQKISSATQAKSKNKKAPQIKLQSLEPTADLSQEEVARNRKIIQAVIKQQHKFIGNCYGEAILNKGSEHLKGTLMIGFDIDAAGRAHATRVLKKRSNLKSPELQNCLIAGLKNWDFPIETKGAEVTVNYPFIFQDRNPKNMQNKMDEFQKIMKTR